MKSPRTIVVNAFKDIVLAYRRLWDDIYNIFNGDVSITGELTTRKIIILDATPILVFQDSDSPGAASVGYIEWRDKGGGRAGFFGNHTSGNDDLMWKNEQGGNIVIQTTGAGMIKIIGDIKLNNAKFLIFDKASGNGIKVDTDTPTFGWRDLRADIRTRGVGGTDPNDSTYRGNLKAYAFSVNDEAWIEFHIPHDYVKGTDIFLHYHWSHNSAAVTGGTITIDADVIYAKGHGQVAFSAEVTLTLSPEASAIQYQHMVSEVQLSASSPSGTQIDTDDLEPDGLILARVCLTANNMTGASPDPFIHEVDVHFQSTNIATKSNSPDFYT